MRNVAALQVEVGAPSRARQSCAVEQRLVVGRRLGADRRPDDTLVQGAIGHARRGAPSLAAHQLAGHLVQTGAGSARKPLLTPRTQHTIGFDDIFSQPFIVAHPAYVDAVEQLLEVASERDWHNYMLWTLVATQNFFINSKTMRMTERTLSPAEETYVTAHAEDVPFQALVCTLELSDYIPFAMGAD